MNEENNSWDEMIPFIECAIRNSVHQSTGETPFFLLHGRDMRLPYEEILQQQRVHYNIEENCGAEIMARLHKAHTKVRELLDARAIKQQENSLGKARMKEYKMDIKFC